MNTIKKEKPSETLACVIIDDPLLKPRYGCLDYQRLLQEMKEHRFFTESAFIPLFLRRYPKDKSKFIDDLDAGRPIIIVEHHGAFKNGYKEFTDLIDWINGLGNIM